MVIQLHVDVLLVRRLEGRSTLPVVVEIPGRRRVGAQHLLVPAGALLVFFYVVVLQLLGGDVLGRASPSTAFVRLEERVLVAAKVLLVLVVGLLVAEAQLLQVFAVHGFLAVVPDDEQRDAQDAQGAHQGADHGDHVALTCEGENGFW